MRATRAIGGDRVRALFTFVGGAGHAEPMVPVAHALQDAGHTVAFAGHARYLPALERRGFVTLEVEGRSDTAPRERRPLMEPSQTDEDRVLREHYATEVPRRRVARYLELFNAWGPDLIIRDEVDFGAAVLSEQLGIPHSVVLIFAAGSFIRPELVAASVDRLRVERCLAPDPELAALHRGLTLSPFPPSLRDPGFPLPAKAHSFRTPLRGGPSPDPLPAWWGRLAARPVVYVSLGTVFASESGDLFARLLAGLHQLPVEVVVTVGGDLAPSEFGPQPEHVHIEQWVPQSQLLPHVDLVISHGGSGTVVAALAHGLPQIVVAMGADQMYNADRVQALGVGRALNPVTTTPDEIRDTTATLLADRRAKSASHRVQLEIANLPEPESALAPLEALVALGPPTSGS